MSATGNKIVCANEEDMQTIILKNGEKNLTTDDFMIVDGLDDLDTFTKSIQDGTLFFATWNKVDEDDEKGYFNTQSWDVIGTGAIREQYDKSDDAAAEAKYQTTQSKIQNIDKKLELELDRIETERNAIQTEMDSVKKVVEDNVEKTFQVFS